MAKCSVSACDLETWTCGRHAAFHAKLHALRGAVLASNWKAGLHAYIQTRLRHITVLDIVQASVSNPAVGQAGLVVISGCEVWCITSIAEADRYVPGRSQTFWGTSHTARLL